MLKISHWSVRSRVLLLSLLPAFIMFILLITVFVWQRINDAKIEVTTVGQILSSQLAAAVEYPVISGNFSLLEPLVENAMKAPAVIRVSITAPSERIIYQRQIAEYGSFKRDDIAEYQTVVSQEQEVFSDFSEFDDINNATLIRTDIAYVTIELSHILGRDRAFFIVAKSMVWASLILFFCLLLAHRMANSVARPIENVSRALSKIAQGNLDSNIKVSESGEIGELQTSVNSMAAALQKSKKVQAEVIKELDIARLKAESANKAKSDFLAIVSHELRTPINGAMGAMQLIAYQKNKSIRQYVDIADHSLNALLELVEDMLTLSSLENSDQSLTSSPTYIPTLLQHTLLELEEKSRLNNNELTVYMDGLVNQHSVQLDGVKFRQLVRHLLGNAVKFTQAGRIYCSIYLEGTAKGFNLRLDISDNGIGFPGQQKETMLEAFQQQDTSLTRQYDGLGIGLPICNDIIDLMGGDLAIMANKPKGTTVNCSIPVQLVTENQELETTNAVLGDKYPNKKFLVVEDNKVNRVVAEKILRNMKFSAVCVESGSECLEAIKTDTYDLIFMDCHMPGMDGFETTQALRQYEKMHQCAATPIIAVTANTSAEIKQRCLASGMSDYVAKPIKMDILQAVIEYWLDRGAKQ